MFLDHHLFYVKKKFPVGTLWVITNQDFLLGIHYESTWEAYLNFLQKKMPSLKLEFISNATLCAKDHLFVIRDTLKQLEEYFLHKRKKFSIPYQLIGTEFQKETWKSLEKIPYGETIYYQQQAKILGNDRWSRAVGRTNSLNPISIILPCHRVIGKNNQLTGYAGGLKKKKFLLQLEGSIHHFL